MKKILFFLALSFLWGCASKKSADTLIYNAHIYTVDSTFSEAEAMAIRDGLIVAIGSEAEVLALKGPRTEMMELNGRVVLPGFIDIHTHSDFTLLVDGRADSAVCQGVTTEVVGQCGFSAAPLGMTPDPSQMLGHLEAGVALDWRRMFATASPPQGFCAK